MMRVIRINNPDKLIFGAGSIEQFTEDLVHSGHSRVFVLASRSVLPKLSALLNQLQAGNIYISVNTSITAEPTFRDFENTLKAVRAFQPDCIAGIGGGSVMDMAKILAVFNTLDEPISHFVGTGLIPERSTRLICIPTTSGTGSEVSPNSILLDESEDAKKGIISPWLVPDAAFIDPELTLGLPPDITAYTGIDALTHCIEAYVNKFAHPMVDPLALEGIRLISGNLVTACSNGNDITARTNLSLGSVYGGMCLGPVNTGAVHALAYPLGSFYKIAHGLSNAVLLPHVLRFNLPAAAGRYASATQAMGIENGRSHEEQANEGIAHLESLMHKCKVPGRLRDLGIPEQDIPKMAESALKVQRLLKNNVREVSVEDAIKIYEKAF